MTNFVLFFFLFFETPFWYSVIAFRLNLRIFYQFLSIVHMKKIKAGKKKHTLNLLERMSVALNEKLMANQVG